MIPFRFYDGRKLNMLCLTPATCSYSEYSNTGKAINEVCCGKTCVFSPCLVFWLQPFRSRRYLIPVSFLSSLDFVFNRLARCVLASYRRLSAWRAVATRRGAWAEEGGSGTNKAWSNSSPRKKSPFHIVAITWLLSPSFGRHNTNNQLFVSSFFFLNITVDFELWKKSLRKDHNDTILTITLTQSFIITLTFTHW